MPVSTIIAPFAAPKTFRGATTFLIDFLASDLLGVSQPYRAVFGNTYRFKKLSLKTPDPEEPGEPKPTNL